MMIGIVAIYSYLLLLQLCHGQLTSSASLTICDKSNTQLNCKSQLIFSLSLNQGQLQQINSEISSVTNSSSQTTQSIQPISISITKTVPYLLYPLYYIKDVNAKPYEEIIYGNGFLLFTPTCAANGQSNFAECKAFDLSGREVENSQGQCCKCTLQDFMSNGYITGVRSKLNCQFFSTTDVISAHCMRFAKRWYSIYELGLYDKLFQIQVQLRYSTTNELIGNFSISPTNPSFANSYLQATLQGDFASFKELRSLQDKYLLIPSYPSTDAFVTGGPNYWMLVDKTRVSLDGFECNKIGTSHTAFQNQVNFCTNKPMTCLQNQIDDLYQEDIETMKNGATGKYLVSNYGTMNMLQVASQKYLTLQLNNQNIASALTFQLDASKITVIRNLGAGKIRSATVAPFESMSKNGLLTIVLQNTGTLDAEFSVTVTECSPTINPILARSITIKAASSLQTSFDITTSSTFAASNQCTIRLLDVAVNILDTFIVTFDTTTTQVSSASQTINSNGTVTSNSNSLFKFLGECSSCLFYDILCKVTNGCFTEIIIIGIIIIIAGIVVFALIACTLSGGWSQVLTCCCSFSAKLFKTKID